MKDKIKLKVLGLSYSQIQTGAYALILSHVEGRYRIPIVIGPSEAQSIAIKMEGITPPRPLSHDLIVAIIRAFGVALTEVFIYKFDDGIILPYPGRVLTVGSSGEDVKAMQEYLLYIRKAYPAIPELTVDGDFGAATERAVIAFNNEFGIPGNPARVNAQTWNTLTSVYEDLYLGNTVRQGQFPGYTIGE
jgi:hypothetical protein